MLKISTLNRGCLDQVEAFSRDQLAKICETHHLDPVDWYSRLGALASHDAQQASGRDAPAPSFSKRHMLKFAMRTHLYSLGGREISVKIRHLKCLPDGNTLLSGGADNVIRVWNLSSKQCVCSFRVPDNALVIGLDYGAGHVIASSISEVFILTMEGQCLHRIGLGLLCELYDTLFVGGPKALIASRNNLDAPVLSLIDIASGELISRSMYGPLITVRKCSGADDWLLELCEVNVSKRLSGNYREDEIAQADAQAGIHALNRLDLAQESHLHGNFWCMEVSNDGSIMAINSDGVINVLRMENGALVCKYSLTQGPRVYDTFQVLELSGSLLFIPQMNKMDVVDIKSGTSVRSITLATQDPLTGAGLTPSALASNGREIFCGFSGVGNVTTYSTNTIKAYLL